MVETAFGVLLRGLREDRDLSLRELAQEAAVDHAYIYRLETGDKEAPSDEVINKLIAALSPDSRYREMLKLLASQSNIDPALVGFARSDASVSFDEFRMLTTVVNRGARPDYQTSLSRIRRFMSEDGDG